MQPYLFTLFNYDVYSYGLAMVVAFTLCFFLTLKQLPKDILRPSDIYNFSLITMASLLVGSKFAAMVQAGDYSLPRLLNLLKFWQPAGFSFVHAFLCAIILVFFYCKIKKIPLLATMDFILPLAILGVGIHRSFGCFLGGCCYGTPTTLPWGITFPTHCRAGAQFPETPIHPTQLYYGLAAFIIFAFLMHYKKKKPLTGQITGWGFIMLAAQYFFITFLRADIPTHQLIYNLSPSQFLALGMAVAGIFILSRNYLILKKENISIKSGTQKEEHVKKIFATMIIITCLSILGTAPFAVLQAAGKTTSSKKIGKQIVLLDTEIGSILNPVKCDGPSQKKQYLLRLRDKKGNPVIFEHSGTRGPTQAGHYLDRYKIQTLDHSITVEIYMDMYCKGQQETNPIRGFLLSKKAAPAKQRKHSKTRKKTKPANSTKTKKPATTKQPTKTQGQQQTPATQPPITNQNTPDPIPGFDDPVPTPLPQKNAPQKQQLNPSKNQSIVTTPTPNKNAPHVPAAEKIPGFDDVAGSSPSPAPNTALIYLSIAPIMDATPKKKTAAPIDSALNQAVDEAFKDLDDLTSSKLHMDSDTHTLKGQPGQIKQLISLAHGNRDATEKLDLITTGIMEPKEIDLIVTGTIRYEKTPGHYIVTPIIISKATAKLVISQHYTYKTKRKGRIKKDFKKKIVDIVQQLMPNVFSGQTGNKFPQLYISLLPFSETGSPTASTANTLVHLLNETISDGVHLAKQQNNSIRIDDSNHTIQKSPTHIKKFNNILIKDQISDPKKQQQIAADLIIPNDVDFVVAVDYKDDKENQVVFIKPLLLDKSGQLVEANQLIIPKTDLMCKEAGSNRNILCPPIRLNITGAFRKLIEENIK